MSLDKLKQANRKYKHEHRRKMIRDKKTKQHYDDKIKLRQADRIRRSQPTAPLLFEDEA